MDRNMMRKLCVVALFLLAVVTPMLVTPPPVHATDLYISDVDNSVMDRDGNTVSMTHISCDANGNITEGPDSQSGTGDPNNIAGVLNATTWVTDDPSEPTITYITWYPVKT